MKNRIKFKRLCDINYETFEVALEEIILYENRRKKQLGRPQKFRFSIKSF